MQKIFSGATKAPRKLTLDALSLIDGVFYDMAAPSYLHQLILGSLFWLFAGCTEQHDYLVLKYLEGAPNLAMEIRSSSTRSKRHEDEEIYASRKYSSIGVA